MRENYILEINTLTDNDIIALKELLLELSKKHPDGINRNKLEALQKNARIVIARERETQKLVGCLTANKHTLLTGLQVHIDDVAVSSEHRRKGIASELVHTAIKYAKEIGANSVHLTSNSTRAAAHTLYKSLGFEITGQTNKFKYTLSSRA